MNADVLVFNHHGVGQIVEIERLPRLGETIVGYNWRIAQDGGKGSNCAIALGRMGVKTAYVGKVGNDAWGDLGKCWMEEAGVDVSCLLRSDEISTGTGLIMLMEDGQNTIVHGESSFRAMTDEEIESCIKQHQDAQIMISGFEIPAEKALFGLKIGKSLGMKTLLNYSPIPKEPISDLSFVDIVVINEQEGEALTGIQVNAQTDLAAMMCVILGKYHCGNVIMTLGARGAVSLDENRGLIQCESPTVQVVDSTGAGDAFLAAFSAGLVWKYTQKQAMEWAVQYAAHTVTTLGTIPSYPQKNELETIFGIGEDHNEEG